MVYELLLDITKNHLGDESESTIKGALDEIIAIMKTQDVQENDKKV